MKKRKIFIRVDENSDLGSGHINRCFGLASILNENFDIYFVIRDATNFALSYLNQNFNLILVKSNEEALSFFETKSIVILDGYAFPADLQKKIKALDCYLVCLDERTDVHYYSDILISYSASLSASDFSAESYTKFYLGLDYLFLREEFLIQSKTTPDQTRSLEKNVFICFGGSDKLNLSSKVVNILIDSKIKMHINLVIGPANKNSYKYLSQYHFVTIHNNINPNEIINLAKKCSFAIVSASTIMLEIFSIGLPVMAGYYSSNQEQSIKKLNDLKLILSIGNLESPRLSEKIFVSLKKIPGLDKVLRKNQKNIFKAQESNILDIFKSIAYD